MKYSNFIDIQKQKNLRIFSKANIEAIFDLSSNSSKVLINRYLQKGFFVAIKRGMYYSKDLVPSKLEIANRLCKPSYISLNTALSDYGLIPEIVYEITSVTTSSTKAFFSMDTSYTYKTIKKVAFAGYEKINGYFIAIPEKAVADYLYFVSLNRMPFNDRLKLNNVNKKKVVEYASLFSSKALNNWIKNNYDRQANYIETIN